MVQSLKNTYKKGTSNALVLMALFMLLFGITTTVWAAKVADMSGWGNTETVGDISFNCEDGGGYSDVCATSDYKVSYHEHTADANGHVNSLQGYAWSPYIGWIRFADWSECPTDPTGATCRPRVDHDKGEILGWARACGGATNNLSGCPKGGTSQNPDSGGWDGWISLSCRNERANCNPRNTSNKNYGWVVDVNSPTGVVSGYAWGGGDNSQVVGWLRGTNLELGTSIVPQPPTVTLDIYDGATLLTDGQLVGTGETLELRWTISPSHSSTNCTATNFVLPADPLADTNQNVVTPGADTTITYTLDCSNDGGSNSNSVASVSVRVPAPPSVSLAPVVNGSVVLTDNLGPAPEDRVVIISNDTDVVQFNWVITHEAGDIVDCSTQGAWSGSNPRTSFTRNNVEVTEPLVGNQEDYILRCTGLGAPLSSPASNHVLVRFPASEVDAWTVPTLVDLAASDSDREVGVFWNIVGYDSGMCTITGNGITGSPLNITGPANTDLSGSQSGIVVNGETDFSLTCSAGPVPAVQPGGTDVATVQVSGQLTED